MNLHGCLVLVRSRFFDLMLNFLCRGLHSAGNWPQAGVSALEEEIVSA